MVVGLLCWMATAPPGDDFVDGLVREVLGRCDLCIPSCQWVIEKNHMSHIETLK